MNIFWYFFRILFITAASNWSSLAYSIPRVRHADLPACPTCAKSIKLCQEYWTDYTLNACDRSVQGAHFGSFLSCDTQIMAHREASASHMSVTDRRQYSSNLSRSAMCRCLSTFSHQFVRLCINASACHDLPYRHGVFNTEDCKHAHILTI